MEDRLDLKAGNRLGALGAMVIAGMLFVGSPAGTTAQELPIAGFADLVDRVAPAVVNISTTSQNQSSEERQGPLPQFPPGSPFEDFFREFFERDQQQDRQRRPTTSLGSGFVIDADGFVVTNNHVIAEADEIKVIFSDDSEYDAEVIGRDPKTDLALLKIEGDEPFPFVEWADSSEVRVGQFMIAIGNPFGLGSTVTSGIISAIGRDIRQGPYDDFFQVDAAINRGNSGGPSFTLDGKVFGVNTAIFSPSGGNVGIGFAIPSNLAKPVIASLRDTGRVARGWLGVRIQTVTEEIAESLELPDAEGALVASVTPGGPAAESDIQPGDVILQFDNKKIERMRGLPRIVAETEIGKEVTVELWRRGEIINIPVTLGELPTDDELAALTEGGNGDQAPTERAELEDLGLTIAKITDETRETFQLSPETNGVLILEVKDGSTAAEQRLRPGDIIVEVAQEPVSSPPEVLAQIRNAKSNSDKRSVLMLIESRGDLRFVALSFAAG